MRSCKTACLCTVFLMIAFSYAKARETDSLRVWLDQLNTRYQQKKVNDSLYIRSIDSVVFSLFDKKDLPTLLDTYHSIVFSGTGNFYLVRRIIYFQYLGIYEVNNNSNGKAIFYFEKMAEEARKQKSLPRAMAAHRAMINILFSNQDFQKCYEKYQSIRPDIQLQTDSIRTGKIDPLMADGICGILELMTLTFYKMNNIPQANETYDLLRKMRESVNKYPDHYKAYLSRINTSYYEGAFCKASYEKNTAAADSILQAVIKEIRAPDFPTQLKPFFLHDVYEQAIEHFLAINNEDSARRYLNFFHELELTVGTNKRQAFFHESMAKLLAGNHDFTAAYQHLTTASKIKDSILNATLIDRDNNVYAQTESEYSRSLLASAEKTAQATSRRNMLLKWSLGLILLLAFFLFWWYRQQQKNKFLNAKLKMARNIHDEISPMLLYAKLLVKKEKELSLTGSNNLQLIETQLNNTIETVRGLSHDLKSTREFTTNQLYHEIRELLDKTEKVTGITYHFLFNRKEKTLNYFQYQHLRNIVHELVNNTIKHSDWKLIETVMQIIPKKLVILYSDNGPGFEPGYENKTGIGLENIKERVQKLKGELKLNNNYPEGYTIEINIPLT